MSERKEQIADLNAIEAALASLAPAGCSVDRDRLMFLAGQASADSLPEVHALSRWRARAAWSLAMAACALVSGALGMTIGSNQSPQVVERIVKVPVEVVWPVEMTSARGVAPIEAAADRVEPPSDDRRGPPSYLIARNRMLKNLANGVDWLPIATGGDTGGAAASPMTYLELRRAVLKSLRPTGRSPIESEPGDSAL